MPADDEEPARAAAMRWKPDLVFVGFVAIRDPLRDDVKEAVAECRQAGIEVKMITGDNVETARAIAYEIGLIDRRDAPIDTPDAVVLTSPTFNELLPDRGAAKAASCRRDLRDRLARAARPLDKYQDGRAVAGAAARWWR